MIKQLLLISTLTFFAITTQAKTSAEDTAISYYQTIRDKGLDSIVEFMHPDSLHRFKRLLMPAFEKGVAKNDRILIDASFGAQANIDTVRNSSPKQFMTQVLKAVGKEADLGQLKFSQIKPIGAVTEADITHLLCRLKISIDDVEFTQLEIISLKKSGQQWKVMMGSRLEGLAKAIRAQTED